MSSSRGWVAMSHMWRDDVEMAKKDDDLPSTKHARLSGPRLPGHWQPGRPPRRSWAMRIAAYALIIIAVVYFLNRKGSSSSSLGSSSFRDYNAIEIEKAYNARYHPEVPKRRDTPRKTQQPIQKQQQEKDQGQGGHKEDSPPVPPPVQPPAAENKKAADGSYVQRTPSYDGPIKYPKLASTLRAITFTGGDLDRNRNILFAVASLKSAATLLPMACEMAMERESYVHFTFMGSSDIAVLELLRVNGIDKTCPLYTHDARPDHFDTSTSTRLTKAAATAFHHFDSYMHPQAVFIDSSAAEEDYFLSAARDMVRRTRSALIELPASPRSSLAWVTKLDAAALSAWNKVRFDILIHAPATGTGNLKRLLRSLAKADLAGIQVPHITIELPNVIDKTLEQFLAGFRWPRSSLSGAQQPPMVSLRRRVTKQRMDEEGSSVRFIESFWPTDPANSHVLVLSAHTELTPQFFQYVKYSLLYQLHSTAAMREDYRMLGISLSLPTTSIDGASTFTPPRPLRPKAEAEETAFLWQRPNSDAMVILGERWVELHNYVARVLEKKSTMSSSVPASLATKEVSKKYPVWLEYALQLSRLRGYLTLYPSRATADSVIGVHSDLPDVPEEHQDEVARKTTPKEFMDEGNESFDPASPVNMLETLPNRGYLQSPRDLPLLSWDAKSRSAETFAKDAADYATQFRRDVGQCSEEYLQSKPRAMRDANDLFCKATKTA